MSSELLGRLADGIGEFAKKRGQLALEIKERFEIRIITKSEQLDSPAKVNVPFEGAVRVVRFESKDAMAFAIRSDLPELAGLAFHDFLETGCFIFRNEQSGQYYFLEV